MTSHQLGLFPAAEAEAAASPPPSGDASLEYFLGAHRPQWLAMSEQPLFVSHRVLRARRRLPRAKTRWALDSGGFTELSIYGEWRTTAKTYAQAVRRYRDEIGNLV